MNSGFAEVVSGYVPELVSVERHIDGAYAFTKEARAHWLQRLCLRILDRLGCQYCSTELRIEAQKLDPAKVKDFVHQQARAFQKVYGEFPGAIIVGRAQADELLGWDTPFSQIAFDAPGKYMGMTIIIAPYFDGVVCLRKPEVLALFRQ